MDQFSEQIEKVGHTVNFDLQDRKKESAVNPPTVVSSTPSASGSDEESAKVFDSCDHRCPELLDLVPKTGPSRAKYSQYPGVDRRSIQERTGL